MALIINKTFFVLYLYVFTILYFKNGILYFINIININIGLDYRLTWGVIKKNCSQIVIINSKKKLIKNKNKYLLKKN